MRKGLLKRFLAGFMVFALTFMSVDAGCITAMAADLQDGMNIVNEIVGVSGAHGYIELGKTAELYVDSIWNESGLHVDTTTDFPENYSSVDKGYVTSIKNQNPWGTCWAFAACAAMESYALAHGLVDSADKVDFSEYALAYLTSTDNLFQHITGDYTSTTVANAAFSYGGNDEFAFKTLSKWAGIYNEDITYYENSASSGTVTAYVPKEENIEFVFVGQKYIDISQVDLVKAAIMEHGAVTTSYFDDDRFRADSEGEYYYRYEYVDLYGNRVETVDEDAGTNHAVTLVGWNDKISKSDLTVTDSTGVTHTPQNDGAWLVKNSWGTWYGNEGYFWISYEDLGILSEYNDAVVYEVAPKSLYDNIYQHDGATPFYMSTNGSKFASVFTATGENQTLEAISFALRTAGANYTVSIYDNSNGSVLDEGVLLTSVTGTTTYTGYYTVPISDEVVLEEGDVYSVVIAFDQIVYMVGGYSGDLGPFETVSSDVAGQSYQYYYGWSDVTEAGHVENLCIKAFTSNVDSLSEIIVDDIPNQTYSGSAITPDVVVTTVDGTTTLVKGTDYTLSYSNNTNAGTATVTISFIGNYTGKEAITKEFVINPMSIGHVDFLYDVILDYNKIVYTGQELKPGVTVTDGITTLVEGVDYTVAYYGDLVNADDWGIEVVVTFIGNYTGGVRSSYEILPKTLTIDNISPIPDQVYFAQDIEPELVIKDGDYVLVKDKDYTVEYEGNNSISTEAKAFVTFKGNYINEVENEPVVVKFSIIAKSQEDLTITIPDQVYDGTAKEPNLVIMYKDKQLVKDIDYEVSFGNNINVGNNAIAYITFIGSYVDVDPIEEPFTISALELNEESVEITGVEMGYVFTGYEIYIDPVIMYNGNALCIGEDYTIGYSQNRNTGKAIYYIEFIGNYSGRIDGSFMILQKNLSSNDIVLEGLEEEVEYTGETTYNNVIIKFGNIELVKDKDYSIAVAENSESDGVKVGTVTLEIVFLDNYSGAATATYEIIPKKISAEDIVVVDQKESYEYTGQEIAPDILVSVLGEEVDYRIEYIPSEGNTVADVVNAGTVTYKVILTGNYSGEITKTFSITPVSADKLTYKVDSPVYTGLPLAPNVVITYGDVILVSGTDYTLVYDEVVNAGTTQIVVNLTGNYSGSKELAFIVTQKSGIDCTVSDIEDQEYTGEAIEPEIEVMDGNIILVEGTDYTVTYTNNTHAGEANVTITYKGNYSGSESITFNIIPVALDNETLAFVDEEGNVITEFEYVYTRDAIIPEVIVSCGELMFTKDDEHLTYEIIFADGMDHANVGTVEFTVVLKGDFSGEITGTLNILPKSADELAIDSITAEVEYTGEKIIPTITIYHSDAWEKTLVKDVDFVVTIVEGEDLSDGIEVGTVKLCITFIGNYSGEPIYRTFEITPAEPEDITSDDVDINDVTGYISKITAGTTVKAFLAMLDEGATVKITDKDGKVVSNDALLGTGMKVSVMNGTEAVKTYVVIVTGDTNGDGKISITDMIAVKAHLLKKELLTGASEKAADVAGSTEGGDGKVSITDFIKVKAHLLKKETVVGVAVK